MSFLLELFVFLVAADAAAELKSLFADDRGEK